LSPTPYLVFWWENYIFASFGGYKVVQLQNKEYEDESKKKLFLGAHKTDINLLKYKI
jgi:hypothetical protein